MKEIVIKISDEDYGHLIKNKAYFQAVFEQSQLDPSVRLALATINGKVLPKGHGRLIDADAVLEEPFGNTYKDIDIAETIIEADKEDKQ